MPALNALDQQRQLQSSIVTRISDQLGSDGRLSELWLGGSLGLGDDDALSDIDLVLVCAAGKLAEVTASASELIRTAGPVASVHDAPWNAPFGGMQLNVLYDTEPLPIYVDWDIWPPVDRRPRGVRLLSDRAALQENRDASVASIRERLPRRSEETGPTDSLGRFRAFLLPILVKYAWRGRFDDVDRLFTAMQVETAPKSQIAEVLDVARELLQGVRGTLSKTETTCVRRYLAVVEQWSITG